MKFVHSRQLGALGNICYGTTTLGSSQQLQGVNHVTTFTMPTIEI